MASHLALQRTIPVLYGAETSHVFWKLMLNSSPQIKNTIVARYRAGCTATLLGTLGDHTIACHSPKVQASLDQVSEHFDSMRELVVPKLNLTEAKVDGQSEVTFYSNTGLLLGIKAYLRDKECRRERDSILKGSLLTGGDCLTKSVLAQYLAGKKDVPVAIVEPKVLDHCCHASVVYPTEGNSDPRLFLVSGKSVHPMYRILDSGGIDLRLRFRKPFIRFANWLRGKS